MSDMNITVTVTIGLNQTEAYILSPGATMGDLISMIGSQVDGMTPTRNGEAAGRDTVLAHGDRVIFTRASKGN